jgi:hypothetical protein
MNRFFFFVVMVIVGIQSKCMEELGGLMTLNKDILQNVIIPHLSLQSIARCACTCKIYENICDPAKIKHKISVEGLWEVTKDYYRCTQALGKFAQHGNERPFEFLWRTNTFIRDMELEILEHKVGFNLCDKMNAYRKYYSTVQDIDKNIFELLRIVIMELPNIIIGKIVCSKNKKYNIFELFDDETIEEAFRSLCCAKGCDIEFCNIIALLPVESGELKNRAVQYLAKYDELSILTCALQEGYLKVDEEYGNQCTLLHYAALRGCRALTDELLKKGANVHAVNKWGKQPLHYARRFYREHENFGHKYLFRGTGVVEYLDEHFREKHIPFTQACVSICSPWDISEEEADWLRRSCTYSLEEEII